jgi:hypothetical protein
MDLRIGTFMSLSTPEKNGIEPGARLLTPEMVKVAPVKLCRI